MSFPRELSGENKLQNVYRQLSTEHGLLHESSEFASIYISVIEAFYKNYQQEYKLIQCAVRRDTLERRRHPRYRVKETTFVQFSDNPIKIGQIIDISQEGLSFRYFVDENGSKAIFNLHKITLYFVGNGFSIKNLVVKTISNFLLTSDFTYSIIKMGRVGLKFREMTDQQKHQLESLIQNCSIGEV